MISVLLYGRNDAHGYNLHRRAALSLNCLAEVLTDPDDEIIFVDYNTPDELPTFIEAIADTLTERCLGLLRVFRVPAAVHERLLAHRTHLPAVEPVARNAGARRSNAANRWLLSTNTDIVLLPLTDRSLSEVCSDLPDDVYGLPRFELPEWLWEHLPRSDPRTAMAEVGRLGPGLRLDEPTVSYKWIRFDAPGDFQLILREDFWGVDGFDEAMVLGWHVDSNLSRRMFLHRGAIESLEGKVAAYHCNHNRTPTVYHRNDWIANDLQRFFFSVDQPQLPSQRSTWGLAGITLEEVQVRQRLGPHVADTVLAASANRPALRMSSDTRKARFALEYDSSHVLPFIADSLTVSPPDAAVAYIGTNPLLQEMLGSLVPGLGLRGPFSVADLEDQASVGELARIADVFVIDLGTDASLLDASLSTASGEKFAQPRTGLSRAFSAFRRLVELERTRLVAGEHPRRFVLVNSAAVFWNAYVVAQLDCSPTTAHARIRHAIVKPTPDTSDEATGSIARARRLFRWIARRDGRQGRLQVRLGETIEIAELADFAGFGEGWAFPDRTAIWTQGSRSELSIALDEPCAGPGLLTLAFDEIRLRADDSPRVDVLVNGVRVASYGRQDGGPGGRERVPEVDPRQPTLRKPLAAVLREARSRGIPGVEAVAGAVRRVVAWPIGDPELRWTMALPRHLLADRKIDLTLVLEEPVSWSDDRRRGLHLRSITVTERGRQGRLDLIRDTARAALRGNDVEL